MKIRKIVVKVEIDTTDFNYAKDRLWELEYKIGSWCEEKGFVQGYKVKKYEEKSKH